MSISVVIPVFNKAAYVGRAIESVLEQTVSDFELVVVDDGSTDDSAKSISTFHDRRVVLLSKLNGGEGSARNAGIRAASHGLICFLDADDTWEPWFLNEVLLLARQDSGAAIMATASMVKERDGRVLRYLENELDELINEGRLDYFGALARGKYPLSSSSICVRASFFRAVGLFDESLKVGADIEMWVRLCAAGDVLYSRKFSATYHRDAENRSVDQSGLGQKALAFLVKLSAQMRGIPQGSTKRRQLEEFICKKAYEVFAGSQDGKVRSAARQIVRPLQRYLPVRARIGLALSRGLD